MKKLFLMVIVFFSFFVSCAGTMKPVQIGPSLDALSVLMETGTSEEFLLGGAGSGLTVCYRENNNGLLAVYRNDKFVGFVSPGKNNFDGYEFCMKDEPNGFRLSFYQE